MGSVPPRSARSVEAVGLLIRSKFHPVAVGKDRAGRRCQAAAVAGDAGSLRIVRSVQSPKRSPALRSFA